MSKKKSAIIDISKGLAGVSLTTLAAIGGAASNPVLAGIATAGAVTLGTLDSLMAKRTGNKDTLLEIEQPSWWCGSHDGTWQAVCHQIELRLPSILKDTKAQLQKETGTLSREQVQRIFTNQIARSLSAWEVNPQNRGLTADAVARPLMEKASDVLDEMIAQARDDAIVRLLQEVSVALKQLATSQPTVQTMASTTPSLPASGASTGTALDAQDAQSLAELERKWQNDEFDVYMCYHEDDEAEVKEIDTQLKKRGILPWFTTITKPGQSLQAEKNEQIKKIKSAAVLIGKHAVTHWQAVDVEALLDQFAEREMPVIPVFLKDAPQKPEMSVFLKLPRGVDFRKQIPDPLDYLVYGITGKKPRLRF